MRGDAGLVAGETLVDLFPDGTGPLAGVDGFRHRPGGAPANVAVGVASFDRPPAFWTCLGDDAFADFLASTLDDHGIPETFVERERGGKTALAVVTREANAERSFTFYAAETATFGFEKDSVPDAVLDGLEWVHFGGAVLVDPGSRAATFDLVERASDAGCTVTFDPNTRPELWGETERAGRVLAAGVERADVLFCSPSDLAPLGVAPAAARENPEAVARDLLHRGPHSVFLTRGVDGSTAATRTGGDVTVVSVPAFDVDAVDTTGAGDAFTAAALTRFDADGAGDVRDTLYWANAAAALTTTATGAMSAIPDADAVDAFLAGQ